MVDWARLPGVPATLKVVTAAPGADDDDDDIIIREIDQAAGEADFVVVDLEGRATGLEAAKEKVADGHLKTSTAQEPTPVPKPPPPAKADKRARRAPRDVA